MREYVYACLLVCAACSASGEPLPGAIVHRGSGGTAGSAGNTSDVDSGDLGGVGGAISVPPPSDSGGKDAEVVTTLPPGFVQTEIGGYQLGEALGNGGGIDAGNEDCKNILLGVVRDFRGRGEASGHPDFEGPLYGNGITVNLVSKLLGADAKPGYASQCEEGHPSPAPTCPYGPETTTQVNFDHWYRYTDGVNLPFLVRLWFAPQPNGLFTFQSLFFFPLDDAGYGNSGNDKPGKRRNFSFTTELHTRFRYAGGESFQFEGDDDVWVFINGKLAVDLGGLHPKALGTVSLDQQAQELGIVRGNVYDLELFHAERHTPESTFRIDTNLSFVNCGTVPPDIPR
jgi:fibro-slime domain-containing protein